MPTIERIVGMHNYTPEANRDAVWAGLIVRHDNGEWQFVALNGRRHGYIRETAQPITRSALRVRQKYDAMYREKLAHGYEVIDWRNARYGLASHIAAQGDTGMSYSTVPAGAAEPSAAERDPMPRPTPREPARQPVVEQRPAPAPTPAVNPDAESLAAYIASRTSAPEAPKPAPADQPKIRKARRLDF